MNLLIATHTTLGLVALAAGAAVLIRPKGDAWHRRVGWVYAGALAVLCVESFWIRDTTPFFRGFGMFHVMALVSFFTLVAGIVPARLRIPHWFDWHYSSMAWSYIGLVMATGSHFFRPILFFLRDLGAPGIVCWIGTAVLLWGLPPFVGGRLLKRREEAWKQRLAAA